MLKLDQLKIVLLLLFAVIVLLPALAVIVRLALAGGSMLNTPSVDVAVLANELYKTKLLSAENTELVDALNPLDSLSELTAASVDSVELDISLY